MNTTVSGTDDPGQRHVSQIATSSTTQHDECPVATSNQRIIYTTAQLHEINTNHISSFVINKVLDVITLYLYLAQAYQSFNQYFYPSFFVLGYKMKARWTAQN